MTNDRDDAIDQFRANADAMLDADDPPTAREATGAAPGSRRGVTVAGRARVVQNDPRFRVRVIELRDMYPRTRPDRPNLYVAASTYDGTDPLLPSTYGFDIRRDAVRPRPDLEVDGWRPRDLAVRVRDLLQAELRAQGYVVNPRPREAKPLADPEG